MSSKESNNHVTYCILSAGRSGSSFLAHVLAETGVDFGMQKGSDWDPVRGSLEHGWAHDAYAYQHKVRLLNDSLVPSYFIKRYFENKHNKLAEKISTLDYVKATKLVYLTPYIAEHGSVKVIVVYRDFQSYFLSRHKKYGIMSFSDCEEAYCDTYNTALAQLLIYGGVVIDFDELLDSGKNEWASALSSLTDIEINNLLEARIKLLNPSLANKSKNLITTPATDYVYERLRSVRNEVVTPTVR